MRGPLPAHPHNADEALAGKINSYTKGLPHDADGVVDDHAYRALLEARAAEPAFDPYGEQRVLDAGEAVFALLRLAPEGGAPVLCLQNVSAQDQRVDIDRTDLDTRVRGWCDLLSGEILSADPSGLSLTLLPYAVRWLKAAG